jgi:hypothetical protein
MGFHCNSIVSTMAGKADPETEQFSITLPIEAIEMIENGLIPRGIYGKKRASVAAQLILDMLKTRDVQEQVREGREQAARRTRGESN